MTESSLKRLKTLREKKKRLVRSNSSFAHIVFKRLVLPTHKNKGLFGKWLTRKILDLSKFKTHSGDEDDGICVWRIRRHCGKRRKMLVAMLVSRIVSFTYIFNQSAVSTVISCHWMTKQLNVFKGVVNRESTGMSIKDLESSKRSTSNIGVTPSMRGAHLLTSGNLLYVN